MNQRMGRFAGLAGATTLVVSVLGFGGGAASATPVGAVPFAQAQFHGYATGDELHLGIPALDTLSSALNLGSLNLDQGFSSASTSTAGLTSSLTSALGTLIQPAQAASVKAFNEGAGLQVSLGQAGSTVNSLVSSAQSLSSQLLATSIAPPDTSASISKLGEIPLDPVLHASALVGEAQAAWPGDACPTGNLSYGLGNLATASVLSGLPTLTSSGVNSAPLISTTPPDGSGGLLQSKSVTTMVPNGDGSYGIQTVASDVIAPISVNLLGLATLNIGVHTADNKLDPVTLTSTTSGESSKPASTVMSTDDLLTVTLTPAGSSTPALDESIPLTPANNGQKVELSLDGLSNLLSQITLPGLISYLQTVQQSLLSTVPAVGSTLSSTIGNVLTQLTPLANQVQQTLNTTVAPTIQQIISQLDAVIKLNLGSITIDTVPHAIGNDNSPVTAVGGTQTGGAVDLLNINLGLTDSSINLPAIGSIPATTIDLPTITLANPVVGYLESASALNAPIACTTAVEQQTPAPTPTTPPTVAPKLPFTGAPGGLWQPVTGVALLGVGGGALSLVRRMRRKSAAGA
jgi:hypothetical protein